MAIIKCENCGGKVSDKAKACPHCGSVMIQSVPSTKSESNQNRFSKVQNTPQLQKKKSAKKTILAIVGTILFLFIAVIAFGFIKYRVITFHPAFWERILAAERGNSFDQVMLGDYYCQDDLEHGPFFYMPQNYIEAVKWYRRAAEQDDAVAQGCMGFCYENGFGVPQDYNEAIKWYQKAAEQGNDDAKAALQRLGYQQ